MDVFDETGEGMHLMTLTAAQTSGQQQQERPNSFATPLKNERCYFLNQGHIGVDIGEDLILDGSEILVVTIPHISHGL